MSAGSGVDRKQSGISFQDFTLRPELTHVGIIGFDGQEPDMNLYRAIDEIRSSSDVQLGEGPFVAKALTLRRPTMLKGWTINGTLDTSEPLFLENCTVTNLTARCVVVLIRSRVPKTIAAPLLYLIDSVVKSFDRIHQACYWGYGPNGKDKSRWVVPGFTAPHIQCSHAVLSLPGGNIQTSVRFRRLQDSALVEDPKLTGKVILKANAALGAPETVNGTIHRDTAYEANLAKQQATEQAAPKKDDRNENEEDAVEHVDLSRNERLTGDLREELVREAVERKAAEMAQKAAAKADVKEEQPLQQRKVEKVAAPKRRWSCQRITAVAVGVFAAAIGAGEAAWRHYFPERSPWFGMGQSENDTGWYNRLFGQ